MPGAVISVSHLSKRYVIGHQRNRHDGLRHWIEDAARAPWRWLKAKAEGRRAQSKEHGVLPGSALSAPGSLHPASTREEFWALKDVSFEVKQGEVVGIIGRNGAGKSTLLKILSRITEPTEGSVRIKGRVASLLEVGTGFHPELTGRENIYLNGAILGMSKVEIKAKFDEIVAFSEIERFLDTPVKRYSSGMYVRLAFAVAAHLEPEILIVDEVLAVGDVQFQKKCLGKMQDVSRGGRTVLFVSHNMQAVLALCGSAIWLHGGQVLEAGRPGVLVNKYISRQVAGNGNGQIPLSQQPRSGNGAARFHDLRVTPLGSNGVSREHLLTGGGLRLDLKVVARSGIKSANVAAIIYDSSNYRLIDVNTALKGDFLTLQPGESAIVTFAIEELLLKPGGYSIDLWLGAGGVEDIDYIRDAATFQVYEDDESVRHVESFPGIYRCQFTHQIANRASNSEPL